jgi:hypothetical protein
MIEWKAWRKVPPEIMAIANAAKRPELGTHLGRTYTLNDGSWLVLAFDQSGQPLRYCVLPDPYRIALRMADRGPCAVMMIGSQCAD